ncbi:hypothetical protein [Agrobacterium sp. DSM 25558]|nr:hypothetical protein [Agrobacterium sp. DSM 25558]
MSVEWKALRSALPDDVQSRLDAKREERRSRATTVKAVIPTQPDID